MFKEEYYYDKKGEMHLRYVCQVCGCKLKSSIDCVFHWYDEHRDVKVKIYDLFEDAIVEPKEAYVRKRLRQRSLEEFLNLQ